MQLPDPDDEFGWPEYLLALGLISMFAWFAYLIVKLAALWLSPS
jgi:hypothetical protein